MQHDLDHLTEWFTLNNLMLNVSKTNFMLLSLKGNLSDNLSCKLLVNGLEIEQLENSDFLGVCIDHNLTQEYQV